jgi:hypothetical protein
MYLNPESTGNVIPFARKGKVVDISAIESSPEVNLVNTDSPERSALEQYIRERFLKEYGANINRFMPYLVKIHSNVQDYAALGFRPAFNNRLFLETYFNNPIEKELAEITGFKILRENIVEVGNLASSKPGSSAPLFGALACFLDRVGYEWAVICATPVVQNVFSKLGIPLIGLAKADQSALPEDQKLLWGSYYQTNPLVLAVHVKTAHRCVNESSIGKRLMNLLNPSIDVMVNEWSQCND